MLSCHLQISPMMESLYVAIAFCFLIQGSISLQKDSSEILKDILQRANPSTSPYVDDEPVNVDIHYSLVNVLRADVEHNEVEVLVWLIMQWKDPSLSWSKEITTVKHVFAKASDIWTPDIAFYNCAASPEMYAHTWAKVYKQGRVIHVPQFRVRVTCDLSRLSAEEAVTCHLKAGSWTRSTQEFNLVDSKGNNTSEYSQDSKFQLLNATQTINKKSYACCPETYADVDLAFTFKKK